MGSDREYSRDIGAEGMVANIKPTLSKLVRIPCSAPWRWKDENSSGRQEIFYRASRTTYCPHFRHCFFLGRCFSESEEDIDPHARRPT